jgi:DNA-binding MarR family transcriptional regulator
VHEMLQNSFSKVYDKFKLQFYRKVFELVRERDGSLSAMEAFSLEVIQMLDSPTVGQFADFLNISQSNATYKVNNLIKKGYIVRENSQLDRREYHLILSEKYYNYMGLLSNYEKVVTERMMQRFSAEDVAKFDEMLRIISDELMPECDH